MNTRFFNKRQKQALYILAGGICEICKNPLPDGWHSDHVIPYSKGGETDVINGQALCPKCNLSKGNKTMTDGILANQLPIDFEPRKWQDDFLRAYLAEEKTEYLLVCSVAGGKTAASLLAFLSLRSEGAIDNLVIVTPTDHLRNQWINEDATWLGIHLNKLEIGFDKTIVLTSDFDGVVTTYQQVASKQEELRLFAARNRVLVVFDEIHHCGDEDKLSWGPAVKYAFSHAERKLSLSGTPFRTDEAQIPFVDYKKTESGLECLPDFYYDYGMALADDEVVRDIVFPVWDGILTWEYKFLEKTVTFEDELNEIDSRNRFKTAIHWEGEWMKDVLVAANEKLDYIRTQEGHYDAGGLVVAEDKIATEKIADLLTKISGEPPVIVRYDIDRSSDKIAAFSRSDKKWIVAVRMVSEGVSIPRLRVGVYASNILTKVFFYQVLGRFVRWIKGIENQTAWLWVPYDPKLVSYIEEIKKQIITVLRKKDNNGRTGGNDPRNGQTAFYSFLEADGDEKGQMYEGEYYTPPELEQAVNFFNDIPGMNHVHPCAKAQALRKMRGLEIPIPPTPVPNNLRSKSKREIKTKLGNVKKKRIAALIKALQQNGHLMNNENHYKMIGAKFGKRFGYATSITISDLEAANDVLRIMIKDAWADEWRGFDFYLSGEFTREVIDG